MSPIPTVFGSRRTAAPSASGSNAVDLEAQTQTISGSQSPLPSSFTITSPAPTRTHNPRLSVGTDPVDDFFGVSRTHDSRHDEVRVSMTPDSDTPPPYAYSHEHRYSTELPAYDAAPIEPVTLAQYLFKFGFLFPPFWILGAIILFSPLTAPADFHATKPEDERRELVQVMRTAEVKWAKRCLSALVILLVIVGIIVGTVVGVMNGRVGL